MLRTDKRWEFVIISLATNRYVDYWKQLVASLNHHCGDYPETLIVLLTDQPKATKSWAEKTFPTMNFKFIEIPNLVWPQATLDRYERINSVAEHLDAEIMIYLDADMVISGNLLGEIQQLPSNGKMYFAPHPGYTIATNFTSILNFILRPKTTLKIIIHRLIGPWESARVSTAYVPFKLRHTYLHGAIWFGEKSSFIDFLKDCALAVNNDKNNNFTAKWHDESHLNAYFAKNGGNILSSRFSWHHKYQKFLTANPIIKSVENFGKTR